MDKVICYVMTRNLYPKIGPSLRSLIKNSKPDRVYILCEDDVLPFRTPNVVQIINVSGQTWFRKSGPNYNSSWTWMALMKTAVSKVLTTESRVLLLDVDTLVLGNVGPLFNEKLLPMDEMCFAGAKEPHWTDVYKRLYVNAGSLVMNLDLIRQLGMDDRMIYALNNKFYMINEQDCLNEICKGRIMEIPSKYNATPFTDPVDEKEIVVRHYAADRGWYERPEVQAWVRKKSGGAK